MGGIVSGNSDDGCDRAEIAGPAARVGYRGGVFTALVDSRPLRLSWATPVAPR
ncbi:MAG: hypothetical protein M3510_02315 [Actinomycetota bacterium]|nr:hypothetical protein [Actinomycetota bacterium]